MTEATKWTAGERPENIDELSHVVSCGDSLVALCDSEEVARLIAASPDMAEALLEARRMLVQADPELAASACVAMIDAALAKAGV